MCLALSFAFKTVFVLLTTLEQTSQDTTNYIKTLYKLVTKHVFAKTFNKQKTVYSSKNANN